MSLSKIVVYYDDLIGFEGEPFQDSSYSISPFQQYETFYNDYETDFMSYNLSFSNSYQVDYYTVQGDKFYETFGIIGGLSAFFIFGLGACTWSFNNYKMRYLIGRELYLFDLLKKKEALAIARGRKRKTKDEINSLSDSNKMDEAQIFGAYLLSFVGAVAGNYNINTTLRRVTLIQRKVEKDMDLFEVYKKVHGMRHTINQQFLYTEIPVPLAGIYPKHIYNPDPERRSLVDQEKILSFAKKHNWSAFEQYAVFEAAVASINLK